MNSLHAAFEELVQDVPEYGDLDRAIAEAEVERRRQYAVVAGLVAAAAALIVIAGTLVLTQGKDAAPPPVAPTPTPTPSSKAQAPGPDDHPVTLLEVDGGLLLATVDGVDRVGEATLWRKDAGGWQQVGTVDGVVPGRLKYDSDGSTLRPGPTSLDVFLTTSAHDGVRFSRDGGATWSHLDNPEPCGAECYIARYGDYFYALTDSLLSRAAFGTTTWEHRPLPPSSAPGLGYGNLVVLDDGTLVIEEGGDCASGAQGQYRVSRDRGDTWSDPRALPGSSNCITGTHDNTLYAECGTTSCYYDTGGNGGGNNIYFTTDLVHWEPAQQPVPRGMVYGDLALLPRTERTCPVGLGLDPVYRWVEKPAHRVGEEIFKLFHVRGTHGHEHVLKVSRDDCRTWRPAYRQSSGS